VFGAALSGLLLFLWQKDVAVRLIELTFGIVSRGLAAKVAAKVGSVAEGVRSIAVPRLAAGFVLESLAYWSLNAFGMWVLMRAVGIDLGVGHAVALMGILAIGILLPAGPGMFGNFQLAVSVGLRLYLADEIVGSQGALYIFLLYAIQALLICTAGIVPLYALRLRMSDLMRNESELATAG
jgi:glycosyltransferase 2 family protein